MEEVSIFGVKDISFVDYQQTVGKIRKKMKGEKIDGGKKKDQNLQNGGDNVDGMQMKMDGFRVNGKDVHSSDTKENVENNAIVENGKDFNSNGTDANDKDATTNGTHDNEKPLEHEAATRLRRGSVYLKESGSTTLFAENRLRTMSINSSLKGNGDIVARPDEDDSIDPLVDPVCDPKHPHKVEFSDISMAAFSIRDGIVRSPCTKSHQLSAFLGIDLFFKKEFLQVTGSFKERGARFALLKLSEEKRKGGAIAASAGNHALALAYHGAQLGIPITVIMPIFAPLMKVSCCRSYGATVIQHGHNIQEAKEYGFKYARDHGMAYINGFDHPDVVAGQGTIGLEILEEVKNIDAIIVPVGGGGLVAGVAVAVKTLKPEVQVIGVEAESCPSFANAMYNKQFPLEPESSLADGLAVPTVGINAVYNANGKIDEMVSVCEESIALSILRLLEMEKAVVEGGGAVGLAALISGKLPHLKGKRVVIILTGGNIDSTVLGRTIDRGLAVDGRLIKFDVVVSDRPGGISELTSVIAKNGASIKDIFHERAWLAANVFSVRVRIVAETRDHDHADEFFKTLAEKYAQLSYPDYKPRFNLY
uniref:Tryptophan synthase beta chain-like PALP domain-containing protein n=1 Tax=Panagrolaimus sp. ES5 TaxID=591445 RepID=A0AC34FP70_9BILA